MAERLLPTVLRHRLRDWQGLALRLPLAAIFIAHGGRSLFGWWGGPGFSTTVSAFDSRLGVPVFLAALVLLIQFFGGVLVLVGLLTRLTALALAAIMVAAILMVHLPNGFFINWELTAGVGHGVEMNLAVLGLCLGLVLGGPGRLAIDRSHD